MKVLVVDCCIRQEESRTRKLYEKFLEGVDKEYQIEILNLNREPLMPLSLEEIYTRDKLVKNGEKEHLMFRYANQFKEADKVVIAAPYWDLSFPSLLKVYLEHVSVTGITFGYEGSECVGYCKADKLIYLSTCGGYVGERHLGAEYVKALAEMFGIDEFQSFAVEGLDIDPSKADEIMEKSMELMSEKIYL